MLKQRIITALIMAAIFISGMCFLSTGWLALLFAALCLIGATEWSKLSGVDNRIYGLIYAGLFGLFMVFGWDFLNSTASIMPIMSAAACWWLLALFWVMNYPMGIDKTKTNISVKMLSGILVLLPTWMALVYLHQMGVSWVLYIMMLVWVADIGAYFSGKKFGKRKLAPKVSPGKSWEGVYGAIAVCTIYSLIGLWWLSIPSTLMIQFVLLSIFVVPVSVLGDLFESLLKRHSGHKDSGSILPGHGGVLDRIDGLTSAVPVFVFGLILLGIK